MSNQKNSETDAFQNIRERMDALEARLEKLESALSSPSVREKFAYQPYAPDEDINPAELLSIKKGDESLLESKIGEYGLAWLGNVVLFFGIVFLTQYMTNLHKPWIAAGIGYTAVMGILLLSRRLQKSFTYMSFLFGVFGQILLFYITLRLHFFTNNAIIPWTWLGVALLLVIIGLQVYQAVRRKSEFYTGLALIMAIATAIISDSTHTMLAIATLGAAGTVFLFYRFSWYRVTILAIILTYSVFIIWIMNNPIVGNPIQGVLIPQYSYIYLGACAGIFSMIALIPNSGRFPVNVILTSILVNGMIFSTLLFLWVIVFFPEDYIWLFLSIAVFCIPFSIILKQFSPWKYSPALYALYGFVAISITIYGLYNFPRAYLLLSIQSFLVVSIALWYRSRIIIVMNVFLFILILIAYLSSAASSNVINFSFPVVAILSARVLNWQKEQLNLQTDLIRNIYLIILFCTTLYALYHAIPGPYVTLSWTVAGVLFFTLSLLFRNIKYRWMALASFIATAIYLFLVDLANVEILYRIVAFLFLALISIGISFYYVKKMKKRQKTEE